MSLAQISRVFQRKAHLVYGLIVIVVISGLSVFVSQTLLAEPQEIRKDASTNDLSGYITDLPVNVDSQTGEFYDLQINAYPFKLIKNTGSGPYYNTDITFKIIGGRVRGISSLYGFIQKIGSANEHSSNFAFSYNNSPGTPEFTSESVNLDGANDTCIDLYTTPDAKRNSYIATFCLSLDIVQPGNEVDRRLYSPSSNPWIEFTYTGTQDVGVISMSSSFHKFILNAQDKVNGGNRHRNRVTYFTLTDGANMSDFKDLTYHLTPITSQLSEDQYDQWCEIRDGFDKKYFRYGFSLTHAGGNLTPLTIENKTGACEYSIKETRFVPGWMGLQKSHGYLPVVANPPYTGDEIITQEETPQEDVFVPTSPTINPVSWKTDEATLEADNFYIVAKGKYFTAKDVTLTRLYSDPTSGPGDTYTSLELMWNELGTEMRYYLYFNRDNTDWWTKEMRTYDGSTDKQDIMYARSEPFTTAKLGAEFSKAGETVFTSNDGSGSIHFTNLRMKAFLKPTSATQEETPPEESEEVVCSNNTDFNLDTKTDIEDYVIFITHLMEEGSAIPGDVNCDNKVDIIDYSYIVNNISF